MIPTTTLVIGDWRSWCGACGEPADPDEKSHRTVLGQRPEPYAMPGCDVVWTHVAATVDANIRAADRIRQMRPDLVYLPELVDHRELPFSAAAVSPDAVRVDAPAALTGATSGKRGTPPEVTPAPGSGGPAAVPLTGPADDDPVWIAIRRRGIDAHRPDGPDYTACGRPMRPYGEQLPAAEARAAYSALLCTRCWPAFHVDHARRVAPSRRSL